MNIALLIGLVVLGGIGLGWILHHRLERRMTPILRQLAAEKNGTVESPSLFLMPKLRFSHSGTEVEICSASTGIDGESSRYTYALFARLHSKDFEFRIRPRSLQMLGDKWIGIMKPMSTEVDKLDEHLAIYTNNDLLMKEVLSGRIQEDLLSWAEQKTENRISDIRNYGDYLIYAVTGTLKNYEEYKQLLDTACKFYDAVANVLSNHTKVRHDWTDVVRNVSRD